MPSGPRAVNRDRDWPVLVPLILGVLLLTVAHRLDADEGQLLTGAWNLYNGRRLYEDFFEFIGPASFAWLRLAFEVAGPSYAAALVASWSLLVPSLLAFHALARRVVPSRAPRLAVTALWALLSTAPPLINHNTYSTFLAVAFGLCLLSALERRSRWTWAGAGALAGSTFFFLQPKGLALLLVGVGVLVWQRPRASEADGEAPWLPPAGAFLLAAAVAVAAGFGRWGLGPVTSVLAVAEGNVVMNHLTLPHAPLLGAIVLGVLAAHACRREGLLDRPVAVLLGLQAALWASTLHLPDPWHLAINAFPLLLVLGVLADHAWERSASGRWRLALAGLFHVVTASLVVQAVVRNVQDTAATREWTATLERILEDEPFFAFTFLPSFYFELRAPNPYPNSVLYTGSHPAEHFDRTVAVLSRERPRFVLADYETVAKYGHTLENPVDGYIRRNYRKAQELPHGNGVVEVWERTERTSSRS